MTVETRPAPAIEAPAIPQTKTVADVLRHAALLIEERGWNQHSYSRDSRVCVLGALNLATTGTIDEWDELGIHAGAAFIDMVGDSSTHFNDTPGRTAAEVVAALRAAADAA